jgi:carbon monoxide dehydrogenase subunit G
VQPQSPEQHRSQGEEGMELDHDFTVPVPVDQAWPVLLDVERIAPCMPGATLDSIDGDDFTGRLKVKLGAMTITYKGTARISSRDGQARTVTIEGSGKESRGSGTASATVQAQLHDEGEHTRVTVHTKLNVTGRPAQFGRNILSEVGGKLIGRFADNLAAELARDDSADAAAPAGPTAESGPAESGPAGTGAAASTGTTPQTAPVADIGAAPKARPQAARPSAEAIDLLEFAGPSIAKRAVPVLVGLAMLWTLRRLFRRSKR